MQPRTRRWRRAFFTATAAETATERSSDASGNAVSFLGFKLGEKKPDAEHPYGHARYEYLAGLTVSALVLALGLSLCKEAVTKIIHPEPLTFSWLSIVVLAVSIAVKAWMSL